MGRAFPLPVVLSIVHHRRLTEAGVRESYALLRHALREWVHEGNYGRACNRVRNIILQANPDLRKASPPETMSNDRGISPVTVWMQTQKMIFGETLVIPEGKKKPRNRHSRPRPVHKIAQVRRAP